MKFSFRFVSFFCFSRFDERIKELKLVPVFFLVPIRLITIVKYECVAVSIIYWLKIQITNSFVCQCFLPISMYFFCCKI